VADFGFAERHRGNDESKQGERKSFLNLSTVSFQGRAGFAWILTAIQHPINDNHVFRFNLVVNRVGKTFGQQPMKAKNPPVNPGIKRQRIDVQKSELR
jgi:hypothetical protein